MNPTAESNAATVAAPPVGTTDVAILGGGLAGLTLALQLKQRFPDIDVTVLERRSHPVPLAAHKVGESSVEIGARYFDSVLGLKPHLDSQQLRKFGFRFFFSEGRRDIEGVTEVGASRPLSVPSYQIDRGIFENYLAEEATRRGVKFADQAMVRQIDLTTAKQGGSHRVGWTQNGETHAVDARWVVDACGRAGLVKRKLDLAEVNAHDVNAVWFRIADRIVIDDWSSDPDWRNRCDPQARWLSTNHLCGAGYWVWLIPLASGSHSVGIVADPKRHPLSTMDTFDKAMDWLHEFQPRLFDELDGKRHLLQDFAFFKKFSYGCKQVFSADRWALTGEAGLFLDPFYSPGSDFIAISNGYITDLIARDRAGQSLNAHAMLYDQVFHSFYESTLSLYVDQYDLFGDPEVMPVKVIWDYAFYWGVLAQIYFQDRMTDLHSMSALRGELASSKALNVAMQRFLREWSVLSEKRNRPEMLDQASLPWFAELNRSLDDELDEAGFHQRIRHSAAQLRALAAETVARAVADHPGLDGSAVMTVIASGGGTPASNPARHADSMLLHAA